MNATQTTTSKISKAEKKSLQAARIEVEGHWMERAEHFLDMANPNRDQRGWDLCMKKVQLYTAEAQRVARMSYAEFQTYYAAKCEQYQTTGKVTL